MTDADSIISALREIERKVNFLESLTSVNAAKLLHSQIRDLTEAIRLRDLVIKELRAEIVRLGGSYE